MVFKVHSTFFGNERIIVRIENEDNEISVVISGSEDLWWFKDALVFPLVLAQLGYCVQFDFYCDDSEAGAGAMLPQKGRPIAFVSRILNASKRNYSITGRECLSVSWILNKFRCFFTQLEAKIVTDHTALTKFTNGKCLSYRMVRWRLKLAKYNIVIERREVKESAVPMHCLEICIIV